MGKITQLICDTTRSCTSLAKVTDNNQPPQVVWDGLRRPGMGTDKAPTKESAETYAKICMMEGYRSVTRPGTIYRARTQKYVITSNQWF